MSETDPTNICVVDTPVGRVCLKDRSGSIVLLTWTDDPASPPTTDVLRDAACQLAEYFAGTRTAFSLPLAPAGTNHQKNVWAAICAIPFGGLRTYGNLAAEIGSSARAVGTACGRNPIPIIVPCHRIVSVGGGGGYSGRGGIQTKLRLLKLEGCNLDGDWFGR